MVDSQHLRDLPCLNSIYVNICALKQHIFVLILQYHNQDLHFYTKSNTISQVNVSPVLLLIFLVVLIGSILAISVPIYI